MGLFDLLKDYKGLKKDPNLIILGLDNAGKTTILYYLTEEKNTEIKPTKGTNTKTIIQDEYKISLCDIGGHKDIRQFWPNFFNNCDGIIYVIDASDETRIDEVNDELTSLIKDEKLSQLPLLIFANKSELDNVLEADEIISKLDLENVTDRDWLLYASSALSGFGIMEGFIWLMNKISSKFHSKQSSLIK